MMRYNVIFVILGLLFPTSFLFAQNADVPNSVNVSMVASTSLDQTLPFDAINGNGWRPEAGLQYVKLHLYFDDPIDLTHITVESCAGPFKSQALAYINFDQAIYELQGGETLSKQIPVIKAKSLTFNFQQNEPLCIRKVGLLNYHAEPYFLKGPKIVEGKVTASSTSMPTLSYDVMNLFDSRYEYAWSSDKKADGESLDFQFSEVQHIEKIKIWNGYQRSDVHCYSNARPKTLSVEGDNGYSATLSVKDVMGSQEVSLPQPFDGKHLKLIIKESYDGKQYKDLVISELRFSNGREWFLVNPLMAIRNIMGENLKQFKNAGLSDALNKTLVMEKVGDTSYRRWMFRMRSDGSLYAEGSQEKAGKYEDFYALGNFEVKESTPAGLKLRLFGFLRKYQGMAGDCNGCGRDCNQAVSEEGLEQKIFQDFVTLSKKGNQFVLQNTSSAKKLNFNTLMLQLEMADSQ